MSSRNKTLAFFALIVVAVVIYMNLPRNDVDANEGRAELSETLEEQVITEAPKVENTDRTKNVRVTDGVVITESFVEPAKDLPEQGIESAPTLDQYREDAKRDPHGTPPSLSAIAYEMAENMPRARKDEKTAQEFYQALEKCMLKAEVKVVREVCRENAKELAELFPNTVGVALQKAGK